MASRDNSADADGPLHTLNLLERLRDETGALWSSTSDVHARVERLRGSWLTIFPPGYRSGLSYGIEPSNTFGGLSRHHLASAIGHAALDAAIANYPSEQFTLRNGILIIRESGPK